VQSTRIATVHMLMPPVVGAWRSRHLLREPTDGVATLVSSPLQQEINVQPEGPQKAAVDVLITVVSGGI